MDDAGHLQPLSSTWFTISVATSQSTGAGLLSSRKAEISQCSFSFSLTTFPSFLQGDSSPENLLLQPCSGTKPRRLAQFIPFLLVSLTIHLAADNIWNMGLQMCMTEHVSSGPQPGCQSSFLAARAQIVGKQVRAEARAFMASFLEFFFLTLKTMILMRPSCLNL